MTHILTDSTACMPPEVASRFNIPVIPQVINFGNDSFYEGVNMDIADFMKRLKTARELPKTAAPPPELFVREFERLVPTGEPILCIHPSAQVSGTTRSAEVAAQDFPGADIRVIDTLSVAGPLYRMVECAAEWAAAGVDADTIVDRVHDMMRRSRIYFLVATLDYLARGGRIGGASHLLGSVLQIKPILHVQNGRVESYEKERTHKRAVARLKEIVCEQIARDGRGLLTVMQADALEEGQALADDLKTLIGQPDVPLLNMPPAIITHGGPGILAAGFFTD